MIDIFLFSFLFCSDPVNGQYGTWGACSMSCGKGIQNRSCDNPAPANGGADCAGKSQQECQNDACPGKVLKKKKKRWF